MNNDKLTYEELQQKISQQESELLAYKNIVNNTPIAMHFYKLNDKGNLIFTGANPIANKVLGIKHKELIGKTIEQAFPELAATEFPELYCKIAREEISNYSFETSYKEKRFSGIYDVHAFSLKNNKIAVKFIDITDRKLSEEKRKVVENKLRETFNLSPSIIAQANLKTGFFTEVNSAVTRILGYSIDEFKSKPIMEMIQPIDRQQTNDEIENQISGNDIAFFENRYLCKDGSYKWMAWHGTKADKNGIVTAIGYDIDDRKKTEIELVKAKEKVEESGSLFKGLFNKVADAIFIFNPDNFEIIEANEATSKIYGYSRDELIGMSCLNFSAEVEKSKSAATKMLKKGEAKINLRHHKKKDGTDLFVELEAYKINVNNKPVTFSVCHDITDILRFEKELIQSKEHVQESEEKYRALYNNAPLSYQSLDENGCFIDINPMWEKTLGYNKEEVMGTWYGDYLHPDYVEHFRKNFPAFKKRGYVSNVQFKLRRKDQTYIYVTFEGCVGYTPEGKFKQTYCVFKDITEQKAIEKAIIKAKEKAEENEIKFKQAFDYAGIGMALVSLDGNLMKLNQSACDLWGYNEDELLSMTFQDLTHPDDLEKDIKLLAETIEGKINHYHITKRYITKKGNTVWAKLYVSIVRDSQQKAQYFISQIEDITKQVIYEQELIQAKEKAEAKEFLIKEKNEEFATVNEELRQSLEQLNAAKEQSEENENRLSSIIENTQAGYFFIDNDGLFQRVNKAWLKHYKYNNFNEVIGKHFATVQQINDLEGAKQFVDGIRNENPDFMNGDFSRKCKDGTVGYHTFSAHPVYENNKVIGIEGFLIDITKQKQIEQELIASKEKLEKNEIKYRNLFTSMQEGVYLHEIVYDKKGNAINYKIIDANPISEKYLNIKPKNAIGKLATDLFKTNEAPFLDIYSKVAETQKPISFEQYFEPMDRHFLISVFSPKKGEFATAFLDVTLRKKHESEIIKAKEQAEENHFRLKIAQEASKSGAWDWDMVNDKYYWADELVQLFGFSNDIKFGFEAWRSIVHPDDVEIADKRVQIAIDTHTKLISDYRIIKADNSILWIRTYAKTIYKDEKPVRMVGLCIDITEQKLFENELSNAKNKAEESDRLKTAFLQNMSHEIRTPLNAISGFTGMFNKPNLSDEKRKSFISIVQTSSNQLVSIVMDILTISSLETRQEKVKIEKVCINNLIVDLLSIFKQQSLNQNISLYAKQELNISKSEIFTDKTKITKILSNLLSNALKFTHEGYIEFGYKLNANIEPSEMVFYVKDSGIGIKAELQEKIFERFQQADISINKNYGGTGLGLAISKAFTELLGGKIWVDSEPGKGSIFYFAIPYKPANQSDSIKTAAKQNDISATILVAEDEEFNFLYIEELLNDLEYNIIHAKNGQEAVEIVKSNPNISLILMDIKLPILDGYSAAKIIKKQNPEIPIIAQSAYALENEIEKYSGVFDDYLTKPISEEVMIEAVKKIREAK